MRFFSGLVVIAALALGQGTPAQAAAPPRERPYGTAVVNVYEAEVSQMLDIYLDGYDKAKAGDTARAMTSFLAALAHPGFKQAPPAVQYEIYHELAWLEAEALAGAAYVHLHLAGKAAPNERDADYWLLLASCTYALRKSDELLDALIVLAEGYPETRDNWDKEWVGPLLVYFDAHAEFAEDKYRLLKALWSIQYQFDDYYGGEQVWRELFQQFVDRGQMDAAGTVAASFLDPDSIIWLVADNRFSSFAPADPVQQIALAVEAELARTRQLMHDNPRALRPVNMLAWALLDAGRPQEALAVIDEAITRFGEGTDAAPAFDDTQYYDWIYNARSVALHALERTEEALEAQRDAVTVARQQGSDPTYQQINLGYQYVLLDRPQDAISAVEDLTDRDLSIHGFVSLSFVLTCAHHALGDTQERDRLLVRMSARARSNFSAVTNAFACAEKPDELAELFTTSLDDPDTRAEVLVIMQSYRPTPGMGDVANRMLDLVRKVTQRPDVKERLKDYGTLSEWPRFSPL